MARCGASDRGASCLGLHSDLTMQEAARTAKALNSLGLVDQRLASNGVFHTVGASDPIANAVEALGNTQSTTRASTFLLIRPDEVISSPFGLRSNGYENSNFTGPDQ